MKRQITREEMEDLVGEIRNRMPDICLRTTLIAGFPGETRDDVEELKIFLQKMRFDRVGIFTYSHEEGTSAHDLVDNISCRRKRRKGTGNHGSAAGDKPGKEPGESRQNF